MQASVSSGDIFTGNSTLITSRTSGKIKRLFHSGGSRPRHTLARPEQAEFKWFAASPNTGGTNGPGARRHWYNRVQLVTIRHRLGPSPPETLETRCPATKRHLLWARSGTAAPAHATICVRSAQPATARSTTLTLSWPLPLLVPGEHFPGDTTLGLPAHSNAKISEVREVRFQRRHTVERLYDPRRPVLMSNSPTELGI